MWHLVKDLAKELDLARVLAPVKAKAVVPVQEFSPTLLQLVDTEVCTQHLNLEPALALDKAFQHTL